MDWTNMVPLGAVIGFGGLMAIILTVITLYALYISHKLVEALGAANRRNLTSLEANTDKAWNALLASNVDEKVNADERVMDIQHKFDTYVDTVLQADETSEVPQHSPEYVTLENGQKVAVNSPDSPWTLEGI